MENATPINFEITMKRNVREQKFVNEGLIMKITMPRKFGAILYSPGLLNQLPECEYCL